VCHYRSCKVTLGPCICLPALPLKACTLMCCSVPSVIAIKSMLSPVLVTQYVATRSFLCGIRYGCPVMLLSRAWSCRMTISDEQGTWHADSRPVEGKVLRLGN
jgi:hypothetical protein